MPFTSAYDNIVEDAVRCKVPHVLLLPRDNPDLLAFMLDMFEREEVERINDELEERKRVLEERLSELNAQLRELEELKARLETERLRLEEKCNHLESRRAHLQQMLDQSVVSDKNDTDHGSNPGWSENGNDSQNDPGSEFS